MSECGVTDTTGTVTLVCTDYAGHQDDPGRQDHYDGNREVYF